MFCAWALNKPDVAVVMTSRVLVNNPEIKQENRELFLLSSNPLSIQEGLISFLNPANLPQSPRSYITHTPLESSTHHLMVIVSLPNILFHNSLSSDARASYENVFIKLCFLLLALYTKTVLVSQGYRDTDCIHHLLQGPSVDSWFDLAL